ncbi:MAG: hypothetical protein MRY21_00660 [Simkaniaceae bacterium]|nr:hypothetical protein [Simkaniaceae bacterium]
MAEENKQNDGMSVQEIESMAKKYRFELVFCVTFLLAGIFAYIFNVMGWSILLATIGGIVGICLPKHIDNWMGTCLGFVLKQEKVTQIVIGVVLVIISIFLSPIIFLLMGIMGGVEIYQSVGRHSSDSNDHRNAA